LRSPTEILKSFGNKCKKCGTKLATDNFKVDIKKLEGPVA
jgi:tRNA(Ile2) C34 agmatinyltransferase TiaS